MPCSLRCGQHFLGSKNQALYREPPVLASATKDSKSKEKTIASLSKF